MTNFQKKYTKNEIIFVIKNKIIDDRFCDVFLKKLPLGCRVGLDMTNVLEIKSKKFIKSILENKFKMFNLKSEVLMYLAIVLKDGFLKSFMNKEDFFENKRELVKRRFLVA